MKKNYYLLFALFFANNFCYNSTANVVSENLDAFTKSFVDHYEFNTSGRYAHEYHPFILKKTSQSMLELEQAFKSSGFELPGRYILMGYEESAFPLFFPRVSDSEGALIDDEASFKDPRGWSIQLHNRFGTMTGFLFRGINKITKAAHAAKMFEHINPEHVEIFGGGLGVLQKHVFGELAQSMFDTEAQILKHAEQKDWRAVFEKLVGFWDALYRGEYKTGDQQVAGTQDILFSIENANFLKTSKLDLLRFFTGPDITYPIVVSNVCSKEATVNAQTFLNTFTKQLQPVNDKKTLYVFRSFVDGVGKSTLLGNIKNWMKHGDKVENYSVVDNSSTLEFEIFEFDKQVFIADLPAQISHFTHKPEGMVWVDQNALLTDADHGVVQTRIDYFKANQQLLYKKYLGLVAEVKQLLTTHKNNHPMFSSTEQPELALVRNLIILKELETNRWIPFDFAGQKFLGNLNAPDQVRVFTKISEARSEGLKNVQAAQMIFTSGLCFPAQYDDFVANLIGHAKKIGIENVVFVDFLSMYSRSSRENIRINYLMQIMGLIDAKFNPYNSMYRNFTSNSELLAMLLDPACNQSCRLSFFTEAVMRFGLFAMMKEKNQSGAGCRTFSEQEVVDYLRTFFDKLQKSEKQKFKQSIEQKVAQEANHLAKNYKNLKEFVNLYSIDFDNICAYSKFLQHFFTERFKENRLNALWGELAGEIINPDLPAEDGWCINPNTVVTLDSGKQARLLCVFAKKNRDPGVIGKFLKTIRSAWYMSLLNVIFIDEIAPDESVIRGDEHVWQLPVAVKKIAGDRICLIEKILPQTTEFFGDKAYDMCHFEGKDYIANYVFPSTAYSLFGFGADVGINKFSMFSPGWQLTDFLVRKKVGAISNKTIAAKAVWQELGRDLSLSTSYLLGAYKKNKSDFIGPKQNESAAKILSEKKDTLMKNLGNALQFFDSRNVDDFEGFASPNAKNTKQKESTVILSAEFAPGVRLFARMVATLEVVARDLDSAITTTAEADNFFASLKLIEHALLPQFFNTAMEEELFTNPRAPESQPVIQV